MMRKAEPIPPNQVLIIDKGNIFKEPVDLEETPDYLACISNPMDFSTMRTTLLAL